MSDMLQLVALDEKGPLAATDRLKHIGHEHIGHVRVG